MNYMNLRNIDLNLLITFQALMKERSITGAARRMYLSQPAMSHAFDRLQATFKDELLVRTPTGYELTRRAAVIYAKVQQLLPKIGALFSEREFNPASVTDLFRIETSDLGATVLVPRLIKMVVKRAPGIRIDVFPRRIGFERLDANEVDLVLMPEFELTLRSNTQRETLLAESLFREKLVCLVRKAHPSANRGLTLRQYLKSQHVSLLPMQGMAMPIVPFFAERQPAIAKVLEKMPKKPDVRVRVPYFSSLSLIVENTDLIATAPLHIARQLRSPRTRIIPAPREFRSFTYKQVWHSRNDAEPVHQWMRKMMRAVAVQIASE
jgi:DNA-binding transcriptional LysR family regulator